MLSIVIAAVAIAVFAIGGVIAWLEALVMVPAVALGGWSGVMVARRRVPQWLLRLLVIAIGLLLSIYYFVS